jgi:hypothetical protein
MLIINRKLSNCDNIKDRVEIILTKLGSVDNRTNRELYVMAYELFSIIPNIIAIATNNKLNDLSWYEVINLCKTGSLQGMLQNISTTNNTDTVINSISSLLYNQGKGYNNLEFIDHIKIYTKNAMMDTFVTNENLSKKYPDVVKILRKPKVNLYVRPLYNKDSMDGDVVSLNTLDEEFQAFVYKLSVIGVIDFFRRASKIFMMKIN